MDKLCDFMNWLDPDHSVLRCNTSNYSYSMRLIKNNRTREFEYKWTSKYE